MTDIITTAGAEPTAWLTNIGWTDSPRYVVTYEGDQSGCENLPVYQHQFSDEELSRRTVQLEATAKVALKLSSENRDLRTLLEFCCDTLVELNPSNYDHDDVVEANEAAIAVILAIREQLGPEFSPEP